MANHRKVNTKPNRFSTAAACAFLALVLLLLSVVSGVYAKYVWGIERKSAVSAPNFYFTSDLLAENPKTYTLNPGAGGTTSFTFEVRNYADELRNTDMNVEYSIMVTPSEEITVTPASGDPMNEFNNPNLVGSKVHQKYIEGSNVDVANEVVNLIVAQRAYEMNSKAIQASDEMMQQANNLR